MENENKEDKSSENEIGIGFLISFVVGIAISISVLKYFFEVLF